jgi:hypothetical protein
MDANEDEKHYNTVTGEEVVFVSSPEEIPVPGQPLAERLPEPPAETAAVSLAERRSPPAGWCCVTSSCTICQRTPYCVSPDYDCSRWTYVSLQLPIVLPRH